MTEILKALAASQLPSAVSQPSLYRLLTGPPLAHTHSNTFSRTVLFTLTSYPCIPPSPPSCLHPCLYIFTLFSLWLHFLSAICFIISLLFCVFTALQFSFSYFSHSSLSWRFSLFDSHTQPLALTPPFLSTVWLAGSSSCPGFTLLLSQ